MALAEFNKSQVEKGTKALLTFIKGKKADVDFLDDPDSIQLQLGFKKIPVVKNKIVKIILPHSTVRENTSICMFVKDIVNKKQRDYDPTVKHFQELLQSKGVTHDVEIIPMRQIKTEYLPHEARRNLSNMYDIYLADDRIVRLLPARLGKHFLGRKRYPVQVNLQAKDLKKEVHRALNTSQCIIAGKGSTCTVSIAHTAMPETDIVENICAAVDKMADSIPGGSINIRNLYIKTQSSPAIPVYVSTGAKEEVKLPSRKRVHEEIEPEEVTTVMEGKVKVSKYGKITIVKDDTGTEVPVIDAIGEKKEVKLKKKKSQKKRQKHSAKGKTVEEAGTEEVEPSSKKRKTGQSPAPIQKQMAKGRKKQMKK